MHRLFIKSVGIISASGNDMDSIFECVQPNFNEKLTFNTTVSASKLRRVSRYSKLCIATAENAIIDYGEQFQEIAAERRGTIITTGFGAVENNISFCRSVTKGNSALCSPTIFSGTVPNSCVGQACMALNLKGVSTVLIGGEPFEYSSMLFDKADCILCGAVEEYNEELVSSLKSNEFAAENYSDGAAIVCVEKSSENAIAEVYGFSSTSIESCPIIHKIERANAVEDIKSVLFKFKLEDDIPDIIFNSNNNTYFDEYEQTAINEIFGEIIQVQPKRLFGETLGASYSMSVALATMCLKKQDLPKMISNEKLDGELSKILVTGYDMTGNYSSVMIKKVW